MLFPIVKASLAELYTTMLADGLAPLLLALDIGSLLALRVGAEQVVLALNDLKLLFDLSVLVEVNKLVKLFKIVPSDACAFWAPNFFNHFLTDLVFEIRLNARPAEAVPTVQD
jgi:hypothetical protein